MADSPDLIPALGGALGSLLGSGAALASTQAGIGEVGKMTDYGAAQVAPYNFAGANYLGPIGSDLLGDTVGSKNIGNQRINADYTSPDMRQYLPASSPTFTDLGVNQTTSADPINFQDFAKNFNASEGAQYLTEAGTQAQNSSAAARGGMLSGANMRGLTSMTEGIAAQDLQNQYGAARAGQQQGWAQNQASQAQGFQQGMQNWQGHIQDFNAQMQRYQGQLAGLTADQQAQQQDFQQRETSYQNLYGQEAMGLQAGIAEAGTYAQGARAIGSLYGQQAGNAQTASTGFGTALSSVFGALGKVFGLGG